jgi:predicted RNase H-like nuclease (RuvC/YqgF family)
MKFLPLTTCLLTSVWMVLPAAAQEKAVYRCPGNPVLYTDTLSAKEAKDKGCRTLEGAPITVVQSVKPRSGSTPTTATATTSASRGAESRVDPNEQRARDTDARRILETELRKEEEALASLQKEYNSGEPDRKGDERNYQKYLDRVSELKANIARKESDVAALKRELGKLP